MCVSDLMCWKKSQMLRKLKWSGIMLTKWRLSKKIQIISWKNHLVYIILFTHCSSEVWGTVCISFNAEFFLVNIFFNSNIIYLLLDTDTRWLLSPKVKSNISYLVVFRKYLKTFCFTNDKRERAPVYHLFSMWCLSPSY